MKRIHDTKAGRALSVWVILKGARHVATVRAHYGDSVVRVEVSDSKSGEMQFGRASGYGYDKFTAALSGLIIDGHVMNDHCGARLKPPRGLGYFPRDFKVPRGYRLENYAEFDSNGKSWRSYDFMDAARAEIGDAAPWESVDARAKELRAAADLTGGYMSCHREAGLKFLQAKGYRVIQAL